MRLGGHGRGVRSFRRQTAMAQQYAAEHSLDLDEGLSFQDLGVSAFRRRNMEAGRLADFLEAVRAGQVSPGSFLLVEALDRLSRMVPRKAVRALEDIIEEGVVVVTLTAPAGEGGGSSCQGAGPPGGRQGAGEGQAGGRTHRTEGGQGSSGGNPCGCGPG